MREVKKLTYEEAMVGLKAMWDEAMKQPDRAMSMCVVDDVGALICFARMDGAPSFLGDMAYKKAFTSAQHGSNTRDFRDGVRSEGMDISYFNLPMITHIPGGCVIVPPKITKVDDKERGEGTIQRFYVTCSRGQVGATGASGRISKEDEELALVGAQAIQKFLWPGGSK